MRARLKHRRRMSGSGSLERCFGTLAGVPVVLALTGAGARNAREGMRVLLSEPHSPRLVVVIGLAGGLDARSCPADLVLGGRVSRPGCADLRPDDALLARASRAIGQSPGWIATSDRIACSPLEKHELRSRWAERLSAVDDLGPGVVDLESWWVAKGAEARGVPWLVVRSISDALAEDLPVFLEECRSPQGGLERGHVVARALRAPRTWPTFVRLAWRTRHCGRILASAVERILAMELACASLLPGTPLGQTMPSR